MLRASLRILLSALFSIGTVSCGLISSDVTSIEVGLPSENFNVDTADWHVVANTTVPTVSCDQNCASISDQFCSPGICSVDCNQTTNNCEGIVDIVLINDFDLATESPEYAQFASHSAISATLDDVWFQIGENTLDVATPELDVFVGPMSATGPSDSGVVAVGSLPSVPAGATGKFELQISSSGRAALTQFIDDYKTPFRIIVAGTEVLNAGDPVPQGRIVGTVQATAHVSL